jgi:hypothetical protein
MRRQGLPARIRGTQAVGGSFFLQTRAAARWVRACARQFQEVDMLIREHLGPRAFAAALAALTVGVAVGCDDNSNNSGRTNAPGEQRQAQTTPPSAPQTTPSTPPRTPPDAARPPATSPGAAPSAARLVGTWTVTEFKGGPADGRSDRSETTTYRFEDGGRVTVAGSKQCAYALQETELKVDCNGQITAGKIEFRGDQTMLWNVGTNQVVTLTKR